MWVYTMEKQVKKKKIYSGVEGLPTGRTSDRITEGCLCLEGGGWRGLYTVGVLDALMVNDINLRTTIGISAGALSGIGYVAGQIGWSAGIDLQYRHDPRYCGRDALLIEHGIMGYQYLFNRLVKDSPLDKRRLKSPERRLYVGATNMLTGEIEYFEKGTSNIYLAAAASASVPYLSKPVMIDGVPYLDGGCVEKIPYPFAKAEDGSTTVIERPDFDFPEGIYVDIFPIDGISSDEVAARRHIKKYKFYRHLLFLRGRDPFKHGKGPRSWWPLLIHKLFSLKGLQDKVQRLMTKYSFDDCEKVIDYDFTFRGIIDKRILGEPREYEFEGKKFLGVQDAHKYLTDMYGDYMTPPPKEKQIQHNFYYMNLELPYREFARQKNISLPG